MKNYLNNSLNNEKVLQLCRKLSTNSTQKLRNFESVIDSEKTSAKKYLLLEDKCNVLSKLNIENVEKLLDFKINSLWKYRYGSHNCCLVQLNREIDVSHVTNRFGYDSNSFPVKTRMIRINSIPDKLLTDINNNESNDNSTEVLIRKRDDSLKVAALKRLFNTNEELLNYLLNHNQLNELTIKLRFFIILQLEELLCNGAFNQFRILPFGSSLAGNYQVFIELFVLKVFL